MRKAATDLPANRILENYIMKYNYLCGMLLPPCAGYVLDVSTQHMITLEASFAVSQGGHFQKAGNRGTA